MGTSLNGLTPASTYQGLIKTTDNAAISGTAKYISDGLGNDSALAISTGNIGIGTNNPTGFSDRILNIFGATGAEIHLTTNGSGTANSDGFSLGIRDSDGSVQISQRDNSFMAFATNDQERMRITSGGNVGIGTSSPAADTNLAVLGNFQSGFYRNVTSGNRGYFLHLGANTASGTLTNAATLLGILNSGDADGYLDIQTRSGGTLATRVSVTNNGLTFNGDTAAANALDDYEEGTWTPSVAFGGASVGLTYGRRGGTYTKIGRQVTICADLILSAKGSSTGNATITGLPFTINGSSTDFLQAASFRFAEMSFSGLVQGYGGVGTTLINMEQVTSGANAATLTHADFEDGTQLMISLTYFV